MVIPNRQFVDTIRLQGQRLAGLSTSLLIACTWAILGCGPSSAQPETLTLATTTSTRDSGLLDVLLPRFEEQTGIQVKVVAVGSGQALELGRRGDADVLLTHAPQAEREFMAEGFGEMRRGIMHNDFVIVGPDSDPANIRGQAQVLEALEQIAQSQAPFVSRGDQSGTHRKEMQIWNRADRSPNGPWYIQAGAGMAEALRIASQKRAYTLTDRGTFLAQRSGLDLTILCEGDPLLQNDYSAIVINSQRHPHVHHQAARRFVDFLLSSPVQEAIEEFGIQQFGEPLFFPKQSANKPFQAPPESA